MINDSLTWFSLKREQIPGVLLGMESPSTLPLRYGVETMAAGQADLVVGYDATPQLGVAPRVALIGDDTADDLLSWIHTFSSETFPLSQFCRIEHAAVWRDISETSNLPRSSHFSTSWASVIVGEMLSSQSDLSLHDLQGVPLSWANSCYSFAMARVFRNSGNASHRISASAADRLRTLESDGRFLRRRNRVDAFTPIWALLSHAEVGASLDEVVAVLLLAVDPLGWQTIKQNGRLSSSSAEQRVHGFREVAAETMARQAAEPDGNGIGPGPTLAASALLAGKRTSHIGLLSQFLKQVPSCLPWFGLIAGFAGPNCWDTDWLRLVRGVDRQVQNGFNLLDPVQADLVWLEFDWLRKVSKSKSIFDDLPKIHTRLLNVEIMPGASCQIRFESSDVAAERGSSHEAMEAKSRSENQTLHIEKLRHLAREFVILLGESPGEQKSTPWGQPSLFSADERNTKRSSRQGIKKTTAKRIV